jgi:hypothetical protein
VTRKFPAVDNIEQDAIDKWCRKYFTCYGRSGVARHGKNRIIRRSRRDAKFDLKERFGDVDLTPGWDRLL